MEIIAHGRFWINGGKAIQCPECNSNQCRFSSVIKEDKEYSVECKCSACGCEFDISRVED